MTLSKHVCMCILSTVFFTIIHAGVPAGLPPSSVNEPKMSNEEQMLAQQLDSVFDELTKGMSENEKNQFFNELNTAMEQEIEKMSNMNDDELTKYIQDAENELKEMGSLPEPTIEKPAPIQQVIQQPSKPETPIYEKEKESKKPSRDMLPVINEITAKIDSFTQKANQVVDISSKFEKWGNKGKLRGWNPTMTWPVFKGKLDALKNTFLTIRSLDVKTQKPKYLADLNTNEALCNNINQFKTILVAHEPMVQAPSFGLKKLSKAAKKAFISVINDCLEALLALNLQAELEKIIAKYEPTAKKIKEAEEKAQQAALEASKRRPTTPTAMKTTVRRGEEPGYYEFGDVQTKHGYPQYGPSPYAPEKKAEPEEKDSKTKEGTKPEGKGHETKPKEEKKGPESKKEDVKETETSKKVEQRFDDFTTAIQEASYGIEEIVDIRTKMNSKNPDELNKLAAGVSTMRDNFRVASKALRSAQSLIPELDKGPLKDKWVKKFRTYWSTKRSSFIDIRDVLARVPAPIQAPPAPALPQGAASVQTVQQKLQAAQEKLKSTAEELASAISQIDDSITNITVERRVPRIR